MEQLERRIERVIVEAVQSVGRSDLFRTPLVAYSSAHDEGYFALKSLIGGWHLLPAELLPEASSVISYFVPFTKQVVHEPKTVVHGSPLWSEAYQEINRHFEVVNRAVSDFLESEGHVVKTIRATHTYNPEDMKSMWSHRSAAAIAGLGAFGANRMLITQKGCGGRFCTVITSAPLTANKKPAENKCLYVKNGTCGLCFKICPVGALRPDSLDKFVCQDELNKNQALLQQTTSLRSADTCGKCISICPVAYIE